MESKPFLTIDGNSISCKEALQYLQVSGDFPYFINKILRQYILKEELKAREDIQVTSEEVEQAVIDFRLENQLTQRESYQNWLASQGMDNKFFHQRTALELRLKKIIEEVTEPKLHDYFIEHKPFLDIVVLSRILVSKKELSEELLNKINEGESFEKLAQEHSLAEESILNGMMGPIKFGTLPEPLQKAINPDFTQQLIGPIQVGEKWGIFRVEQFLPASLYNETLKQEVRLHLFEAWLGEKIKMLKVEVWGGE